MPVQVLPNNKILNLGNNGTAQVTSPGVSTSDLVSMMFQPKQTDPRSGTFAPFAGANANMYGSYAGLLGAGIGGYASLGNSYASALNGYGNALGSLAQAGAASDAARYGAYSKNTSDYQGLLGALGVSALGAYGNASNAALQSQAMRDTAAFKMFGDAAGANQTALASYGGQQAAAQAALGHAASNAGTGMAAARSGLGNAYSNLGSSGAGAMANVAGNSMNYTRDMAKVDLARTLAPGAFNTAASIGASIGAGLGNSGIGGGGGSYSIGGPGGSIASIGGGGGQRAGGGATAAPASTAGNFNPGQGWYSGPQYYDAGGKDSVLNVLASSQQGIADQAAGIDRDSANTFGSIDRMSSRVADRSILDSLNQNFGQSWSDMRNMYQSGRQDSSSLLKDIYKGTLGMASPFLTAGREAFGATMNNLPQPYSPADKYMPTYMNGMNQFMGTQNQNITNALTSGNTAFSNGMANLNTGFSNTMNSLGSGGVGGGGAGSPFGGMSPGGSFGGGGNTGWQLHYVNGQPEWQPVGPGFFSPGSTFVQQPNIPAYPQPAPGSWTPPTSMTGGGTQTSPAVDQAQQWADQNAMAQRWAYYTSLPASEQEKLRYNPQAMAELEMLRKWKAGQVGR